MTASMALRARVRVCAPINFGGGTSHLLGRTGTVTRLLSTSRAVMVALDNDGDREPVMFFVRELEILSK